MVLLPLILELVQMGGGGVVVFGFTPPDTGTSTMLHFLSNGTTTGFGRGEVVV